MKDTFGAFISEKRLEKHISLRSFSQMISISAEYLSKIENGLRSAPKDITLRKMSDKLGLNIEEREKLYDLAAESKTYLSLSSDLIEYINENEIVHKHCGWPRDVKYQQKNGKRFLIIYLKNIYKYL